jgi:FHA domain
MTITCPAGHQSDTTDYCNECGALIEGFGDPESDDPEAVDATSGGAAAAEPDPSTATQRRAPKPPPGEPCPKCHTPRGPDDRYCEVDGYDFEAPSVEGATWCAIVSADRAFFDRNAAADLAFPDDAPDRTFTLEGDVISIGRRSPRHDTMPDIDLGEPPADPGVSRQHARLQRTDDGGYVLVDCGSANGTFLDDSRAALAVDEPTPLVHGTRISLGAWTSIVIQIQPAPAPDAS